MKQPHGKGGVCSRRDGVPGPRALESVARGGEHCCVAASEQERRERRTTLPDPFQSGCSVRALSVSEAEAAWRARAVESRVLLSAQRAATQRVLRSSGALAPTGSTLG